MPQISSQVRTAPETGWSCSGYGTGVTLKDAQIAARQDFVGNITVGPLIYTDGQFADGTWWAEITGDCVGTR